MSVEEVLLERQAQNLQQQVSQISASNPKPVQSQPQLSTAQNIVNSQPPIPDLHTDSDSEIPNATQRRVLETQSQSAEPSKEDLIKEKIQQDLKQNLAMKGAPQHPLDVLKSLIVRGEYKEDITLFQQVWTLRALDQSDMLLALDEVSDMLESSVGRLTAVAFAQIVYALEAINGITIYEMFKDTIKPVDYPNQMSYIIAVKKALRRYLEHFPPVVIDSLYTAYMEVDKKRNEALNQLKNS